MSSDDIFSQKHFDRDVITGYLNEGWSVFDWEHKPRNGKENRCADKWKTKEGGLTVSIDTWWSSLGSDEVTLSVGIYYEGFDECIFRKDKNLEIEKENLETFETLDGGRTQCDFPVTDTTFDEKNIYHTVDRGLVETMMYLYNSFTNISEDLKKMFQSTTMEKSHAT